MTMKKICVCVCVCVCVWILSESISKKIFEKILFNYYILNNIYLEIW